LAAEGAPSFVYLPELDAGDESFESREDVDSLVVGGDEAHYLSRVVRVRPGDRVSASDGRGAIATLEILATGPPLRARVLGLERRGRTATLEVWCGAPEGDRGDWLVEKLAELGAAVLLPVHFGRGRWERFEARRERWNRLTIAALRQSRSAFRLDVRAPAALDEALSGCGAARARWVCRPGAPRAGHVPLAVAGRTIAVVGPSSGFTDDELNLMAASAFVPISLAEPRLRTETAAMSVTSLWAAAHPPGAVGSRSGGVRPGDSTLP
jgi:16S rRNA (uracil1498-N3)-methyltransferase